MNYLSSTIGRKQLVGITGIGLSLFVLTHMAGNILLFVGAEAYNKYSYALISNPLIYFAEAGLLLLFLIHLGLALKLSVENARAKEKYAVLPSGEKGTSPTKRSLLHQGVIILVFVVLHLITFKFGPEYSVVYDGVAIRDLFRLVVEVFQSPVYTWGYMLAMMVLGFHLSHGLHSSVKTLGFNHPRYEMKVKIFSRIFALIVAGGFLIQPLYIHYIYKG